VKEGERNFNDNDCVKKDREQRNDLCIDNMYIYLSMHDDQWSNHLS